MKTSLVNWLARNWKSRLEFSACLSLAVYAIAIIVVAAAGIKWHVMPRNENLLKAFGLFLVYIYAVSGCFNLRTHKKWALFSFLPFLVYALCYTYIYWHMPYTAYNFIDHSNRYIRYYQYGTMLGALILALGAAVTQIKPGGVRILARCAIVAFSLFSMLIPFGYVVYFTKYHSMFGVIPLLAVIQTDPSEAAEYASAMFTGPQMIFAGVAVAVAICLSIYVAGGSLWKMTGTREPAYEKILAVLCVVLVAALGYGKNNVFPFDVYTDLNRYDGLKKDFSMMAENIKGNDKKLALLNPEPLPDKLPGSVILVVGESANRDYMSAFNPSYSQNTTPWELEMKQDPHFVFFSQAYSNYPSTPMALSQALTSANQYNGLSLGKAADILAVAKKAGYHTYWFSTQKENGLTDATITVVAHQAETIKWLSGWDDALLEALQTVPADENNFIILHFRGSHQKYEQRAPKDFAAAHTFDVPNKKEGYYDTALAFTDSVLQKVYEYGKDHLHMQAMIYFADHGDNMTYGHTMNPFRWDMVHIPFWMYFSPEYASLYPDTMSILREHANDIFTNDLIFDTVSGILQAPSNQYSSQYDISSNQYAITLDNAKTIRGSKNVKDDPAFSR